MLRRAASSKTPSTSTTTSTSTATSTSTQFDQQKDSKKQVHIAKRSRKSSTSSGFTKATLETTTAGDEETRLSNLIFGSNSAFTTDDNDKDEDSTELGYIIDKTGSVSEPEGNEEDEEDEEDQDNFTEHEQDSRGSHHKNKNKKENNNNNNNKKDKQQGKGHKSQQKQTLLWNDTDDSNLSVSIVEKARLKKLRKSEDETSISGSEFSSRLRGHFEQVNKVPEWAKIDEATKKKNANKLAQKRSKSSTSSNGDDDDDDEYESNDDDDDNDDENDDENDSIFQSTSSLLISRTGASASKATLPSKMIDTLRVKDGNVSEYSPATIQSIGFHPTAPVMLTAGLDKTIRLFQIDGKENTKIQSIHIPNFPIYNCNFSVDGRQVFATSRRTWFYTYDLESGTIDRVPGVRGREEKSFESSYVSPDGKHLVLLGKDGYLVLISTKTKQWVADMKMNGTSRAVCFSPSGDIMYSYGGDGQVYVWDMKTRDCVHRFIDEGSIHGTAIAASADGSYLACGTDSGIVNVYSTASTLTSENPHPLKSVENLTTSIKGLSFNHDNQILAAWSSETKDAMKLIHLPSTTTFANFPTEKTPLHYVFNAKFSPHSGYMGIGNDKGKVLLYRLKHYNSY